MNIFWEFFNSGFDKKCFAELNYPHLRSGRADYSQFTSEIHQIFPLMLSIWGQYLLNLRRPPRAPLLKQLNCDLCKYSLYLSKELREISRPSTKSYIYFIVGDLWPASITWYMFLDLNKVGLEWGAGYKCQVEWLEGISGIHAISCCMKR